MREEFAQLRTTSATRDFCSAKLCTLCAPAEVSAWGAVPAAGTRSKHAKKPRLEPSVEWSKDAPQAVLEELMARVEARLAATSGRKVAALEEQLAALKTFPADHTFSVVAKDAEVQAACHACSNEASLLHVVTLLVRMSGGACAGRGCFDQPCVRRGGEVCEALLACLSQPLIQRSALSGHGKCSMRRVCGYNIPAEQCVVKPRMNGRYLSVRLQASVPTAESIQAVHDELSQDSRIMMNF